LLDSLLQERSDVNSYELKIFKMMLPIVAALSFCYFVNFMGLDFNQTLLHGMKVFSIIIGTHLFLTSLYEKRNGVGSSEWKRQLPPCLMLFSFCYQYLNFGVETAIAFINLEVVPVVAVFCILCYGCKIFKSQFEKENRVRDFKINLGCGLARCFYQYLENVIKGKGNVPSSVELLRRYRRDERLIHGSQWICPRVLILFTEGVYPYQTKDGHTLGTRNYLLSKEKEKYTSNSFCVPDDIEYKYEVNGTERKSKLEVIKMKRNNEVFYAVLAENRPLSSLVKLVNQTGKLDKKSEAQVLIKEEELSVHFQVFKRELKRLLDEDEKCKDDDGNPLYEVVHFKETKCLNVSDELYKIFDKIRNESNLKLKEDKAEEKIEVIFADGEDKKTK